MRAYLQLFAALCLAALCAAVSFVSYSAVRDNFNGALEYRRLAIGKDAAVGMESCLLYVDSRVHAFIRQGDVRFLAEAYRMLRDTVERLEDAALYESSPGKRASISQAQTSLHALADRTRDLEAALIGLLQKYWNNVVPTTRVFQLVLQKAFDRPGEPSIPSSVWQDMAALRAGMATMNALGYDAQSESDRGRAALSEIRAALENAAWGGPDKPLQNPFLDLMDAFSELDARRIQALECLAVYRDLSKEALEAADARIRQEADDMANFGARLVHDGESFHTRVFVMGIACSLFAAILAVVIGVAAFRAAPSSASRPVPDTVQSDQVCGASELSRRDKEKRLDEIQECIRPRWRWYLIAVLFFVPSVLYIRFGPDRRIRQALESGDVEMAREAMETIRAAALVGTIIGLPLTIFSVLQYL